MHGLDVEWKMSPMSPASSWGRLISKESATGSNLSITLRQPSMVGSLTTRHMNGTLSLESFKRVSMWAR